MRSSNTLAILAGACCLCVAAAAGCHSVQSTQIERSPEECGWKLTRLYGIPITVKLPSHLEIKIVENRYYIPDLNDFLRDPSNNIVTTRHVLYEVREKDEVFTVDTMRPAAGTAEVHATMDSQYFTSLKGKIEDKTIEAITNS